MARCTSPTPHGRTVRSGDPVIAMHRNRSSIDQTGAGTREESRKASSAASPAVGGHGATADVSVRPHQQRIGTGVVIRNADLPEQPGSTTTAIAA